MEEEKEEKSGFLDPTFSTPEKKNKAPRNRVIANNGFLFFWFFVFNC